jgi:mRNA interferase MazF
MRNAPEKGDIVLVDLSPSMGHEQSGLRPTLVVTEKNFAIKNKFCWIIPITSSPKGYPFETVLEAKKTKGVVLSDQIRSIDWKNRNIKKVDTASITCVNEVIKSVKKILS